MENTVISIRARSRNGRGKIVLGVMLGVMLGAAVVSVGGCHRAASIDSPRPNILLISIDTLRADHLGVYGYARDTSPEIDEFARSAFVFEEAYSTSCSTAESHMSMFTSLYPSTHRILNTRDPLQPLVTLSPKITTLAEILRHNGYTTVGFHGGGNVSASYGFDRGFDRYDIVSNIDPLVRWLEFEPSEPFFAFFHTFHVHDPYTPSPPYDTMFDPDYTGPIRGRKEYFDALINSHGFGAARQQYWDQVDADDPREIEHLIALYDGEIREIDLQIGVLTRRIRELFPDTIIVLVADHGEEFREHGEFLHVQLYNEVLRVPLIVSLPQTVGGERIAGRVSLIDLAPTILNLLGIQAPADFRGSSLSSHLTPQALSLQGREVFAESVFPADDAPVDPRSPRHMVLVEDRLKAYLMSDLVVYDLDTDPRELAGIRDHAATQRIAGKLQHIRDENDDQTVIFYQSDSVDTTQLTAEDVEKLRALGYVE